MLTVSYFQLLLIKLWIMAKKEWMYFPLTITVVYHPAHAHCSYCLFLSQIPTGYWQFTFQVKGHCLGSLVCCLKDTKKLSVKCWVTSPGQLWRSTQQEPLCFSDCAPDQVAFHLPVGAVLVNGTNFWRMSELLLSLTNNEQMSFSK